MTAHDLVIPDRGPWWAVVVHATHRAANHLVRSALEALAIEHRRDELLFVQGSDGWTAAFFLRNDPIKRSRTVTDHVRRAFPHNATDHEVAHHADLDMEFLTESYEPEDVRLIKEDVLGSCDRVVLAAWNDDGPGTVWSWNGQQWVQGPTDATTLVESRGILIPWWEYRDPEVRTPTVEASLLEGISDSALRFLSAEQRVLRTLRGVVVLGPNAARLPHAETEEAARVVSVTRDLSDGTFRCSIRHRDGHVGRFELRRDERPWPGNLPDVEGETDPHAIVRRLGIPEHEIFAPPLVGKTPPRSVRPDRKSRRSEAYWVVLAPGTRDERLLEIARQYRGTFYRDDEDVDEQCGLQIVDGAAGYVSISQLEPGSGDAERLAEALSCRGSEQPTYAMSCLNDDNASPSIEAYVRGERAGVVTASSSALAAHLGCWFPGMSAGSYDDAQIRPHPRPIPQPGELTFASTISGHRWTAAEWDYMINYETDWWVFLDDADERTVAPLVDALDHADVRTRRVACRLLETVCGRGSHADHALPRLQALSERDPDVSVREAARNATSRIEDGLEAAAFRREFPWIWQHDPKAAPDALRALDDPRTSVRRAAYAWWMKIGGLSESTRRAAQSRLRACRDEERDPQLHELARYAALKVDKPSRSA